MAIQVSTSFPTTASLHTFTPVEFRHPSHPPRTGTLHVTETAMQFIPNAPAAPWTAPFTDIALHALSTDPSAPPACVYVQMGEEECVEVRFVAAAEVLTQIYEAFCEGAARNADEEGEVGDELFAGGGGAALMEGAEEMMARLDGMVHVDGAEGGSSEESGRVDAHGTNGVDDHDG